LIVKTLLLVALSALAVACGSPEPEPALLPTPSPAPIASPTASALPTIVPPVPVPTADPAASRGGVLNIAARTVVDNLDVHREFSPTLAAFGPGIVYSRLLRFQTGQAIQTPSLAVECDLCEAWAWDNPTTLRVTLRDDVRWQSIAPVNGRFMTAADVVASFERQRTPGWPNAALLQNIDSMEAAGNDVVFTLKSPDADFVLALADGHSKVLPVELSGPDDLGDGPFIGTGPWMLDGAEAGTRYVFSANPTYFEPGFPYLDGLNVFVLSEEATRRAAFLTKTLDVDEVKPDAWSAFQESHPEAGVARYSPPGAGIELALNVQSPALQDINVRRALFRALDPWALNQGVWSGLATVASGLPAINPSWLLSETELHRHLADPGQARQLLQGASPAVELVVADFGDNYLRYGEGVRDQLEAVGFQVELTPLNPTLYNGQVWRERQFQAYLGPMPPVSTPNGYLYGFVHTGGRWNKTGFSSTAVDDLIDAQGSVLDVVKRQGMVKEVSQTLLADGVRFMPAAQVQAWSWWPRVQNLHLNFANYEYIFWSRVWVEG
jgi:peptide/nickel transport system substrate-binding protein